MHRLRHVGAYHSAATPPAHTRYQRHARTLYSPAQPPYYNKVYKDAAATQARRGQLLPCVDRWQVLHLLRGQRLDASNARRLAVWHRSAIRAHRLAPSTRRGSPAAGARRAARNHWRLAPQLFSGFRPIANRGQQ